MPLYVKDDEVDRMAERVARLQHVSKTEAVRRALHHELERTEAVPTLVDRGLAFMRTLRTRANPEAAKPTDKAFIDGLYEKP
jgi:antitoxin VapB